MALRSAKLNALLQTLRGPTRRAFEQIIAMAKTRANVDAMIRAIESGDINAAMAAAGMRDGMWTQLTENIRLSYSKGGAFTMAASIPKRFGVEFNINNPRAELQLRNYSSHLISGQLFPEQERAIQVMLSNGMARGANPRATALDIVGRVSKETGKRTGGVIGLTGQQAQFVTNMSNDLVDLNARYFERTLRDKRYDGVVRASMKNGTPLPESVRNKIVGEYENRMLRHRGETVARTETLRAINEANDEALRQVVDSGLAPANAVIRIWRHSFSDAERQGHLLLNGVEKGIDEPFTNPITGAVLKYPGDGPASESINCRCYIENKIDFAAVEIAKDPSLVVASPQPVSQLVSLGDPATLAQNAERFYEQSEGVALPEGLTRTLKQYQGEYYRSINASLRGDPLFRDTPGISKTSMDALLNAFKPGGAAPALADNILVLRGLGKGPSRVLRELGIGDTFIDDAMLSTTLDKRTAYGFANMNKEPFSTGLKPVVLRIQAETGTKVIAMNFKGVSTYNLTEYEILFGPGTRFQIIDISEDETVLLYTVKVLR